MSDLLRQVPDDAIREPGVYQISHERYLSDPVIEPSLNSSTAKILIELSPAHARQQHPRFNAELDVDATSEQDVGTAVHSIFLNGEDTVELVDAPDWRTKAAKEARAEVEGRGHIALLKERYGAVHQMVSALERFRQDTGAFTDGRPEQTLVWREGPIWCRCKPDWLPNEPSAPLFDLKTSTANATLRKWTRSAFDLGADVQSSFYCRGAESIFGEPPEGMNFCVIESKAPYGISVFSFSPASIEVGDAKTAYAIRLWTWCMADNRWPSYRVERQWVEPPIWILREWEHLTATGTALRQERMTQADNLAAKIIEHGNFAG
jgi:hypothetical protein